MVCNHWWHDPRRLLVCDPRVFEVQRTSLIMTRVKETVKEVTISTSLGSYALFLHREDLTDLFPTMVRYTLTVDGGGERRVLFCTNSYEYAPLSGLDPESITIGRMKQLESALRNDPVPFLKHTSSAIIPDFPLYNQGVAIIQGSPRAEGNCSILAEWVLATATANRRKTEVIFPHDMDIHPCIGCYRCYNTGRCTYDDDMTAIINTIRNCSLLVICTPVYTNTVPGSLKLLIDRCQAFHAERSLYGDLISRRGILIACSGRPGSAPFTCVNTVVHAFMDNLGIQYTGELLVDRLDTVGDVRKIPGLQEKVEGIIRMACSTRDDRPKDP